MSTPEIIGPVIDASTLAELAALPVAPFLSGQTAFVTATGRLYVLQNALGTVDNYLLIATADDAARQWVDMAVVTGFVTFVSPLIDFTQAGIYQVITPIAKHLFVALGPSANILKDGTITTAPTLKIGTNASNDNMCPSVTPSGFTTAANGTRVTINVATGGTLPADFDLTANGLRLQITSPAVLGTASYLTGRIIFQSSLQAGPWIP
jgi:hypothetical protein